MNKLLTFALLMVALSSGAQWSNDAAQNFKLTNQPGEQVIPKVRLAPNGDYYVGYFSLESGNYNVRLQRMDNNGNILWPENGILISAHPSMTWLTDWDMAVDQNNHAVLVWQDIRTGNNNIAAYRIGPDGSFSWGQNGIMLSNSGDFDVSPKVIITNAGNAVVAWQADDVIIRQKLSPSGEKLWGPNGITLSGTSTHSWPQLFATAEDDVIMKYFIDSGPFWAPTRHVFAQRFNSSGAAVWPTATTISNAGSITAWTQIFPMISDEEGGFYVCWNDFRVSPTLSSAWVQHVRANGQTGFAANGVKISSRDFTNQFYPAIARPAGSNFIYAYWNEVNGDQNLWGIYGQKIGLNGSLHWGEEGKEIIPITNKAVQPNLVMPIENDVVMLYESYFNGTQTALKAMRLNADGIRVWPEGEVSVSAVQSNKVHLDGEKFDGNQWVFVWEDNRTADVELYAQNLRPNGQLGAVSGDGIITGTVTTEGNMAAVEEVLIQVSNQNAHPQSDGTFSISLAAGTYDIIISHPFTQTTTIENLVVVPGQNPPLSVHLMMQRTDIELIAHNQWSEPVMGAAIHVSGPENVYNGITNESGRYNILSAPFGHYSATASYGGQGGFTSDTIINATNHVILIELILVTSPETKIPTYFSIEPNPVTAHSKLIIPASIDFRPEKIELFNSQGKLIGSTSVNTLDFNSQRIDIQSIIPFEKLKKGQYYLRLSTGQRTEVIRFIK